MEEASTIMVKCVECGQSFVGAGDAARHLRGELCGYAHVPRAGRTWVRSSYCGTNACVEVADDDAGRILIRDSGDAYAPPLVLTREEWSAFVRGVIAGDFSDIGALGPVDKSHGAL